MASKAPDYRALIRAIAQAVGAEDWAEARAGIARLQRAIPGWRAGKLTEDRSTWIRQQMADLAMLVEAAGVRDVQGQARLRAELRLLRDMLDAETERQRQADTSGGTAHLEERLTEALSLIDDARLRRVLLEVERRKGVTLSDWLRDG